MTANDETPLRSIELEVEVPGTPEQVWEAIATGPGITAWFVPAEVEERPGGAVGLDMGAGIEYSGRVTTWEPPRRFVGEEEWPAGEKHPTGRLATEFLVEARSGGTCVVRLVTSVFASGGDWDGELERASEGWRVYLNNLRLYLTHFAGRRCSTVMVNGSAPGPREQAWSALTAALGLPDAAEGERVATTTEGAPALAGVVELVADGDYHRGLALRLEEPAPGYALLFLFGTGERVFANAHAYLFGDDAPAVAAREQPVWEAWMQERFPAAEASAAPV